MVDGYCLEQFDHYTYLGSIISNDGRCLEELKKRIAQTKSAFWKNKEIIRRNININLKLRMLSCYVNSVATNGSETWTYSREIQKNNAFEMWTYRCMLKISWRETDRVELTFELPLAKVVFDFFDKLKNLSKGYASLD